MEKERREEYAVATAVGCCIAAGILYYFLVSRVRAALELLLSIVDKEGRKIRRVLEGETAFGEGSRAPAHRLIFYGSEEDAVALDSIEADEEGRFRFPIVVEGVIELGEEKEEKEVVYRVLSYPYR